MDYDMSIMVNLAVNVKHQVQFVLLDELTLGDRHSCGERAEIGCSYSFCLCDVLHLCDVTDIYYVIASL
jgi:hypothetical protein